MDWEAIYKNFMTNIEYPEIGKKLSEEISSLSTREDYRVIFILVCEDCGFDSDEVLTQLVIDKIGWNQFIEKLYKISEGREVSPLTVSEIMAKHKRNPKQATNKRQRYSKNVMKKSSRRGGFR